MAAIGDREFPQVLTPELIDFVLTPAEVAQRWKCSAAHVRKMIDNGELPAFRAGNKLLRIRLSDVVEYEALNSTIRSPVGK